MVETNIRFGDNLQFPRPLKIDPAPCPVCGESIIIDGFSSSPNGSFQVNYLPAGGLRPAAAGAVVFIDKIRIAQKNATIHAAQTETDKLLMMLGGSRVLKALFPRLYHSLFVQTAKITKILSP